MPVFYPFLITIIPILHILAGNPGQTRFSDALVPMLISLAFTLVAFVVLRLVLKNWDAAGLIVSLFLVLFFLYGHLFDYLHHQLVSIYRSARALDILFILFCVVVVVGAFLVVKYRSRLRALLRALSGKTTKVLVLLYVGGLLLIFFFGYILAGITPFELYKHFLFFTFCAILVAGVFIIVRYKDRLQNTTRILNVVAAAMMVLVLINIFISGTEGKVNIKQDEVRRAARSKQVKPVNAAALPDIYYIILDSYGSESFLRNEYHYDNSRFIRWLESHGFYVARDSHSNYNSTYSSLSSSLNLHYLDQRARNNYAVLRQMIEDNSLMRFLKSRGYKFAFMGSQWTVTQHNRYADVAQTSSWINNEFARTLLNTTAVRYFSPEYGSRKGALNAFSSIPEVRKEVKGPLFLFAHINPPHSPYLFDRNGKPLKQTKNADKMYVEQLMFVNKKTKELTDRILSTSDRPAVIVIQGDHSPKQGEKMRETAILNAYHLPVGKELLYPSISPVNSFRVILNSVFGTDFKLLKDHSY